MLTKHPTRIPYCGWGAFMLYWWCSLAGRYLRGANLIAQVIDFSLFYYLFNAHGDVVQRVEAGQNHAPVYKYDAFGNERKPSDTDPNPFRYCGEYFDLSSGEYYLRARTYDPRTGRFATEDPARAGENWYGYSGGNPVIFADSSGLAPRVAGVSLDGGGPVIKATPQYESYNTYQAKKKASAAPKPSPNVGPNLGGPPAQPKRYDNIQYPDLTDYGFPDWAWPELSEYVPTSPAAGNIPVNNGVGIPIGTTTMPAFTVTYSLGFTGGGTPYDLTGNAPITSAFSQSTIIQNLIDEHVEKFRQTGQAYVEYSLNDFPLYNGRENLADHDLMLAFGTFDICWIICEEMPNGSVSVMIEVIDSYKFLEKPEAGYVADSVNVFGYLPQEWGWLTPYTLRYSYTTMR